MLYCYYHAVLNVKFVTKTLVYSIHITIQILSNIEQICPAFYFGTLQNKTRDFHFAPWQ